MTALALVLAVLGAAGIGFTLGSRRERSLARADAEMWRALATGLHAENARLREDTSPVVGAPEGKPNALHSLRTRLEVSVHELARRLGIPVADVDTIERTPFGLLEVDSVEKTCNALGCRLDVVAVHRLDGIAHWLSDDHVSDRLPPAGGAS